MDKAKLFRALARFWRRFAWGIGGGGPAPGPLARAIDLEAQATLLEWMSSRRRNDKRPDA